MYYKFYTTFLANPTNYNTTDIKVMAKMLVACGLCEYAQEVFDDYPELNSSQDVHDCLNARKDRLEEWAEMEGWEEEVDINKLQASIEELLNCQTASELNSKFDNSELHCSETGVEESETPFKDFDSLEDYEKNDHWDFRFGG
jgi:hypothetical protein